MKKTINNFHCSNHGYVDFIPKCAICVKELEASIRKEVLEDILTYELEHGYSGHGIEAYTLSKGISTLK